MKKEVKTTKYYRCTKCGGKEIVDTEEGFHDYGLCWDCYVVEDFGMCDD